MTYSVSTLVIQSDDLFLTLLTRLDTGYQFKLSLPLELIHFTALKRII